MESESKQNEDITPQLRGQELIDDFIYNEGGKITLQDKTEYEPEENDHNEAAEDAAKAAEAEATQPETTETPAEA